MKESEARRQAWALQANITAFRIFNGRNDGGPEGIAVDAYSDHRVVWHREEADPAAVSACVDFAQRDGASVTRKCLRRAGASNSQLVAGFDPKTIIVQEGSLRLATRPAAGLQTGLFLDLRPARRFCAENAKGRKVLNLFAFTGSFSAAALVGGAEQVTSVDASRKSLDWARSQATLNDFDPDAHRWFSDDVVTMLKRQHPGRYDAIVCDPPVFGRAGNKTFSLARDLNVVLETTVRALAPGGWLLFTWHDPKLTFDGVTAGLRSAATLQRRGVRATWRFAPDPDMPGLDQLRPNEVSVAVDGAAYLLN